MDPQPIGNWNPRLVLSEHLQWVTTYRRDAELTAAETHDQIDFDDTLSARMADNPFSHAIWFDQHKAPVDPSGARLSIQFVILERERVLELRPTVVVRRGDSINVALTQWFILELLAYFPDLLTYLHPPTGTFRLPLPALKD